MALFKKDHFFAEKYKKTDTTLSIVSVVIEWSGRQDLNLRPSAPKADAIPSYATSRFLLQHQLARQRGFEPLTSTFVVLHSIQLSYQRTIFVLYDFITLTISFNNIINVLFCWRFLGDSNPRSLSCSQLPYQTWLRNHVQRQVFYHCVFFYSRKSVIFALFLFFFYGCVSLIICQ